MAMLPLTSIGARTPAALAYLQRELILPEHPLPGQYTLQSYVEDAEYGTEEEVVFTAQHVVWAQDGTVKRILKFDNDGERVDHALLTWFPVDYTSLPQPHASSGQTSDLLQSPLSDTSRPRAKRERALVVLLDRKAYIYFSHGPSHTVSIPFEVEKVFPAPKGIILQRRLPEPKPLPATPLFPQAPPNSFWSSQLHHASPANPSRTSVRLNVPSQAKVKPDLRLHDFVIKSQKSLIDDLPRLFALTDPLADVGLVGLSKSADDLDRRTSLSSVQQEPVAFPEHEEILYISAACELRSSSSRHGEELLIALTVNRIKRLYSIWQASYSTPQVTEKARKPLHSGSSPLARSRRRSSFAPRLSVGGIATVHKGRTTKRESSVNKRGDLPRTEDNLTQALEALDGANDHDLVASIEQPFDVQGKKTKTDRRTSSMMARAELSSQSQPDFAELARNPAGLQSGLRTNLRGSQSFGGVGERSSFGRSRLSARASLSEETAHLSDVDEITTLTDSMGDDLDLHDLEEDELLTHPAFDGFKKELKLSYITGIPFSSTAKDIHQSLPIPCEGMKAFIGTDVSSTSMLSYEPDSLAINVTFPALSMLAEIEIGFLRVHDRQILTSEQPRAVVVSRSAARIRKYSDVLDATRLVDGALVRTICLVKAGTSTHSKVLIKLDSLQKSDSSKDFRYVSLATEISLSAMMKLSPQTSQGRFRVITDDSSQSNFQIKLQPQSQRVAALLESCQRITSLSGVRGISLHTLWLFYFSGVAASFGMAKPSEFQAMTMAIFTVVLSAVGLTDVIKACELATVSSVPPKFDSDRYTNRSHYLPAWESLQTSIEEAVSPPNNSGAVASCARIAVLCWQESKVISTVTRNSTPDDIGSTKAKAAILALISALHILHEEESLNVLSQNVNTDDPSLNAIIDRICEWMEWQSWKSTASDSRRTLAQFLVTFGQNGNVGDMALFPSPELASTPAHNPEKQVIFKTQDILRHATPRLVAVTKIFARTSQHSRSQNVPQMLSLGLTMPMLETLPEYVAAPLRSHVRQAQTSPPTDWSSATALEFIGRQDLGLLSHGNSPSISTSESENLSGNHSMDSICQNTVKLTEPHAKPVSLRRSTLVESRTIMSMIYREDRRWMEASKLLNPLRVAVAAILPKPGCSEAEFLDEQKNLAQLIYKRTMAIPSGSAIINFSSHRPMLTEKIEIYPFNTTCNMQPSNNTVNADKSNFTEEKVSWAFFHAGVHAGLRIRADAQYIDTSWLVLNRPTDLGNRHAGLLFALGLNGHLKSMAKWLAFKYLTPKHNMTSIGLLLGLSASHMGSMDSLVTRLLSVHVTRLLPPGAAELNLSPLTQTAGVMGVGLLYYNSQHRRMSEVMLSELESIGDDGTPDSSGDFRDEGYRLAAGFSLGLINLGKGRDARALHDMRLIERLLAVAKGSRSIDLVHVLDQATAGATMAIAMIFMKSHNARLAHEIGIPMNVQQFDYIRPDILLLRTVASNLIMWNDIKPELQWINGRIPLEYRGNDAEDTLLRALEDKPLESSRLPLYNILAGLCWSIALKHAGHVPGSVDSLEILLKFFDMITRVLEHVNPGMLTYDELLTRDAMLRFQHLIALSMATVAAGSGNLAILRRLRYLHGTIQADQTFGLHQACHMAIGVLFMGQGRYTFGTSDLAIASLLCAFYPLFPKDVLDNRAHLQALRHLWVFAAEPRCLLLIDLDKRQPVAAPMSVYLKDGSEIVMEAPCLLPPIDLIKAVEIRSPEHWPVVLDFVSNPSHLSAFVKHQTVALRRKDALTRQPTAFGTEMMAARHLGIRNLLRRPNQKDGKGFGNGRIFGDHAFDWILKCSAFSVSGIGRVHTLLGLLGASRRDERSTRDEDGDALMRTLLEARTTATDDALVLATDARVSTDTSRLIELKVLLDWAQSSTTVGETKAADWIRDEWTDALRRIVATRALNEIGGVAGDETNVATEAMDTT